MSRSLRIALTVAAYAVAVLALALAHWLIVGSLPVGVVL